MDIKRLEKLLSKAGKRDTNFLESFYNNNFRLETKNLHLINSAYKYKDDLNLNIKRLDYSNIHVIKG